MEDTAVGHVGDDFTVVDDDDAVVELFDQLVFMGDHDDGGTVLVDAVKQFHDLVGHLRVHVTGGLVGDDGVGVVDQRAGQSNSLLLTAGDLVRHVVCLVLQADQSQDVRDTFLDLFLAGADDAHGEGHVVIDGHFRDEAEVLEHDAQGPAVVRDLPCAHLGQVIVVDHDAAAGGDLFPHDGFQEGTFTGTGRTDNEDELAAVDPQVDVFQSHGSVVVYLGYISEFDHVGILLMN